MRRVVIDARAVGPMLHGFGRYISLMCQGIQEVRKEEIREEKSSYNPILLVQSDQPEVRARFSEFETVELGAAFLSPAEQWEIPKALKRLRADLYHSPTFSSLLYCPCPWIVTVHDLNHLHFGGIKEKLYYQLALKRFAVRSKSLLTVSEFSRAEIQRWAGDQVGIEIAYNAIDPGFFDTMEPGFVADVLNKYGLRAGRYFFCLSNPKPHKNVPLLVSAYQAAKAQAQLQWPLVLSLSGVGTLPGVMTLGSLPEPETKALLGASGAVFFPSIYEGFGLPPVEAVAAGRPAVVSDIAPHREGLRDSLPGEILWILPTDESGWQKAFIRAEKEGLAFPSAQTQIKIKERYSVKNLGLTMDRIYRSMLGMKS